MSPVMQQGEAVLVQVKVQPKASRNAILNEQEGRVRIALTAAPTNGAANKALIAFVAKLLATAKSNVSLCKGETSRIKTLSIHHCTLEKVQSSLNLAESS